MHCCLSDREPHVGRPAEMSPMNFRRLISFTAYLLLVLQQTSDEYSVHGIKVILLCFLFLLQHILTLKREET